MIIKFFVLIVLTIVVDVLQIVVTTNKGAFMRFVITILEIVLKIGILVTLKKKIGRK